MTGKRDIPRCFSASVYVVQIRTRPPWRNGHGADVLILQDSFGFYRKEFSSVAGYKVFKGLWDDIKWSTWRKLEVGIPQKPFLQCLPNDYRLLDLQSSALCYEPAGLVRVERRPL